MTAIARKPSMSARYLITLNSQTAHGRTAGRRCDGGFSPSQKDTGRTAPLYQKEQEARSPLLAKRVFVENRSSEIQSPTGFAISGPPRAHAETALPPWLPELE